MRKRVLFIDLLSPIGHKNYNYGLLRSLTKIAETDILVRRNFLNSEIFEQEGINISKLDYIEDEYIPELLKEKIGSNTKKFKLLYRIKQMELLNKIKKMYDFGKFDMIIFSSVEIISFSIVSRRFKFKTSCFFIDHAISDIKYSKLKKFFWKIINRDINVVVMEEYIKDYLFYNLNLKNNIYVLPHPLPIIRNKGFIPYSYKKKIIFAPGLDNDEQFIYYLKKNSDNIPKEYKIIVRSKECEFENDTLIIYNSRISDIDYYNALENSEYILIPYTNHYNYKTSGVLFEAITLSKKILLHNNNTLIKYKEKFPNNIIEFSTLDELFNILSKPQKIQNDIHKNNNLNYYYDDNRTSILLNILNGGEN